MSDAAPPTPPQSWPPQPAGSGGYDLGEAFSWAWRGFTQRASFVVGGFLIVGLISLVASGIGYAVVVSIFGFDRGLETRADGTVRFDAATYFGSLGTQSIVGLVIGVLVSVLYVNYARGLLDIAAGRTPTVGQLFSLERAGTSMLTYLIVNVIGTLAFVLLIVPGIVWQIFTVFALLFVAAGARSATDAIGSSLRLVRQNFGAVFLLCLVSFLMLVVGACACLVGLVVAGPLVGLLLTYAFCVLQGHTVAG